MLSGATDLIWDDEYDADNLIRAKQKPFLTVYTYTGFGRPTLWFNTKLAPFDDVRVRKALVMAIDRKKMSQALTSGLSKPLAIPTVTDLG